MKFPKLFIACFEQLLFWWQIYSSSIVQKLANFGEQLKSIYLLGCIHY